MEYQATEKYLRVSTRKLRLIADSLKGMKAVQALVVLPATQKHGALVMRKCIAGAVANAKQKNIDESKLTISRIEVMGGPVMKRWHAASRGMAHPYKKRMTHVSVILTDTGEAK